jgi:transcription termination/antitermination protein NusA
MSKEVLQAIKAICDEKHIPVEAVLSTIEQALAAAYRKDFGDKLQNIKVEFNPETMGIRAFDVKTVVEDRELDEEGKPIGPEKEEKQITESDQGDQKIEVAEEEEEEKRFNPKTEIMISEAKKIKSDAQLGEEISRELPVPGEFGRMAAQTAKQVIVQRLREAEREVIFNEYKDKQGEVVSGSIQRVEGGMVFVDIGQATAIMPISEQVKNERYVPGMQARFYIKSVNSSSRGPEVIVSRANTELVKKLFSVEVPEISDGVVEIKAISREAGSRTKIAVATKEENIDPVGSCVGQRGTRVQFIINELGGEKIDIIEWEEDPKAFIKNALSPAKITGVELNEETKSATAYVGEDQLSLAIGKQGQNVRLASVLSGWRIDIKQQGSKEEDVEDTEKAEIPKEDVLEHKDSNDLDKEKNKEPEEIKEGKQIDTEKDDVKNELKDKE